MLKQSITYTDYNGVTQTEDFMFNLSKAEIMELEASYKGGIEGHIAAIVALRDASAMFEFISAIVKKSYGRKSPDGRRFIKNKEELDEFVQSEAYSELLISLLTFDADGKPENLNKFIKGIIPAGDKVANAQNSGN